MALFFSSACSSSQIPENCEIKYEGVCYQTQAAACAAADCPDDCIILQSYPGQVECTTNAPTESADE